MRNAYILRAPTEFNLWCSASYSSPSSIASLFYPRSRLLLSPWASLWPSSSRFLLQPAFASGLAFVCLPFPVHRSLPVPASSRVQILDSTRTGQTCWRQLVPSLLPPTHLLFLASLCCNTFGNTTTDRKQNL